MQKLTTLLAFLTFSAGLWAIDNVAYIDADGILKYQNNVTEITGENLIEDEDEPLALTLTAGWYVVLGKDVQLKNGAVCEGEVHLILADGAKLTASSEFAAGIQVSNDNEGNDDNNEEENGDDGDGGNSLTIYGQNNQTGQLIAIGGQGCAGIGGGNEQSGSHITINGGKITATGGQSGAGIGGGNEQSGSHITINGGVVIATADGDHPGSGIGGGLNGSGSDIFVATNLTVKADGNNPPTTEITNTGDDLAGSLTGKKYVTIGYDPNKPIKVNASYIDEQGEEQTIKATKFKTSFTTLDAGWYVVIDDVATGTLVCNGAVNLILADGAKLTANGTNYQAGIQVSGDGNSLTIYGQSAQSGQLIATGAQWAAGIGGGKGSNGSNITINGGIVTAYGGERAAGIGGGESGNGSNITINGGIVTANGSNYDSAGIGGGHGGNGSNITINGGKVIANGSQGCTGIGSGKEGSASSKIYVATNLIVKAGDTANPIYAIATTRQSTTDITSDLTGKRFVVIEPDPFILAKKNAIAAINEEIKDADNDNVKDIATDAVTAINAVETIADVTLIQDFALKAIASARAAYEDGQDKLVGRTETSGPAVEVKKGEKTIIIYAPDKVTFKQVKSEL